ncbi:MAG: polysaccharide deacetylase family protein [Acidobacteriota bacterium]
MKKSIRRLGLHVAAAAASVGGVLERRRRRRLRKSGGRVFVLEYHDVSAGGAEPEGTISAQRFGNHLDSLRAKHQVVPLSEAIGALTSSDRLESDLVAVTFDDGYLENYTTAWPELRDRGLSGAIFLTSGFLDGDELWFDAARRLLQQVRSSPEVLTPLATSSLARIFGKWPLFTETEHLVEHLKYVDIAERDELLHMLREAVETAPAAMQPLTWDQVREMGAQGMEFGGHTVTHPILSMLDAAAQEREIESSASRVREELGRDDRLFAYPNGSERDYDGNTLEIVRRLDFIGACTTTTGSNAPGSDPYQLRRIGVGPDPVHVLEARLGGLFDAEMRRLLPV